MKETGLMFTPENIRLVMSGRKTETRRVIAKQPNTVDKEPRYEPHTWGFWGGEWPDNGRLIRESPYGKIGDKVYIKEGIIIHADNRTLSGYYLDGARITNLGEKRLTAMFMPKAFARTWLEITEVRVERLQDISEEDAKAEGCSNDTDWDWKPSYNDPDSGGNPTYKRDYQELWQSINGKKHPWSSNPYVFAISFKRVDR